MRESPAAADCSSISAHRSAEREVERYSDGMDRDKTERDPSHHRNGIVGLLYGEFTDILNGKVRCSVSLTDHVLTVQKITSSPGQGKVVFDLSDCIGCRAFRGEDNADTGAYFSAYFYPFKRRWLSYGMARQRLEQCFRVALAQDPSANLEEAERWARAIRDASFRHLPRRDGEKTCFKYRLFNILCGNSSKAVIEWVT